MVYDNSRWGLVHLEMEGAGVPPSPGATFPNLDFAAFAQACGARGYKAGNPGELAAAVDAWLADPGPAILHAVVNPDEIPAMPHIDAGQLASASRRSSKPSTR